MFPKQCKLMNAKLARTQWDHTRGAALCPQKTKHGAGLIPTRLISSNPGPEWTQSIFNSVFNYNFHALWLCWDVACKLIQRLSSSQRVGFRNKVPVDKMRKVEQRLLFIFRAVRSACRPTTHFAAFQSVSRLPWKWACVGLLWIDAES